MLLGEVLEPVVVEVAPEPDGPQDEDRPVGHPRAAAVGAAGPIDVLGDGIEQVIPQFGPGVDVLQGSEDGDDLVAAVGVESDVGDGRAIEPKLGIEGDSHGGRPSKIPWLGTRKSAVPEGNLSREPQSSRSISAENHGKDRLKHVFRRPLAICN